MTKPKHKQPPKNFLRYFVDEYILFRRDFVIETSASIEDCAEHLHKLNDNGHWFFGSRSIISSVSLNYVSAPRSFKICAERTTQKAIDMPFASVEGTIERGTNNTTIVVAHASIPLLDIIMLTFIIFAILQLTISGLAWVVILYGCVVVLTRWRMYRDRNYLVQQIQHAIQNAEQEAHLSKAKNEQIIEPFDDSSEYQSQRKGES
jgi:hypothetical protein